MESKSCALRESLLRAITAINPRAVNARPAGLASRSRTFITARTSDASAFAVPDAANIARRHLTCPSSEPACAMPVHAIQATPIISIPHREHDVKKAFMSHALTGVMLFAALALSGCGTPAPKDFGGAWKPVNRFQSAPTAIPLARPYTFYASPMDGTLKTMLARWSKDSGMTLSYQLSSDYTLFTPVSKVRTPDIQAAVAQLSTIYAAEGVSVTASNRRILVDDAGSASSSAITSKQTPDTSKPDASANRK